MNRKNTYLKALIIFYLLTLSHIIDAQYKGTDTTIDCNCHLYNLYITQEIEKWPETIHKLKTIYQKEKSDHALFNLVFAQFGYVGYLLNDGYKKEASPYVKAIQKNLDILIEHGVYPARVNAFKGSVIAFDIYINPYKWVFMSSRATRHIEKSLDIDPTCPYGWVENGNSKYYAPKHMGGSYHKAIDSYQRAIKLFESDKRLINCNWYYLNTYRWLSKSYEKLKNHKKAIETLKKIIKIEPEFKTINDWIKNYKERWNLKDDEYLEADSGS